MSESAHVHFEKPGLAFRDDGQRSTLRNSLSATRRRIRGRLAELRVTLDSPDVLVDQARTLVTLEEICFDIANEFSLEEMLLLKHDEDRWYGHRCSHEALLSAMRAVRRAAQRDPSRESLRVTIDAIGDWLLNHFRTVDARDEHLMRT